MRFVRTRQIMSRLIGVIRFCQPDRLQRLFMSVIRVDDVIIGNGYFAVTTERNNGWSVLAVGHVRMVVYDDDGLLITWLVWWQLLSEFL